MKQFSLLLLLFSLSTISYSQVALGVKSGINIATVKDLSTFPKNRIGWYGGAFARIPIKRKFFFQPEILFSSKGYKFNDLADGEKVSVRLNYVTLPIFLGYKIDHKTKVLLGAEGGYLVKASLDQGKFDISNTFPQKFDVAMAIGLEYDLIKQLGIEIRYNYGFKTFYQTDAVGNRGSESLAGNRVFQMGFFYRLLNNKSI
jgi:hypothetical protein